MEKSLIVQGKGLEEALDKAAIVLCCDKERIAYEVLQEPKPGRYGQPGVLCKLRVTPVSPSAGDFTPGLPRDAHAAILDVPIRITAEELADLPSAWFLKEMGAALPRDLIAFTRTQQPPPCPDLARPRRRREVAGDLTPVAGPVEHDGDLVVQGNVRKGVRVSVSGAIIVHGGVETALLEAVDDITVDEGILGTAHSDHGSVRCRFAQGAHLRALEGDILVSESAMHCQIHARRSVHIGDLLLGGTCYGQDLVTVGVAGSTSSIPTTLLSGHNRYLQDQVEEIRQRAQRTVAWIRESEAVRMQLLSSEEDGRPLPPDDRLRLWRAVLRHARLNADLRLMAQKKSAILGMINQERGCRVSIMDRAYPKVKIGIDDTGVELRNVTQYATFSKDYDTGELRITPYN